MLAIIIPPCEFGLVIGPAGAKRTSEPPLLDRPSSHRDQLAYQPVGHLPGHRELALALKFLNRGLGVGADGSGRLQLAGTIFGERPLHRRHPARARRWIG